MKHFINKNLSTKHFPSNIKITAKQYILILPLFFVFRLILFFTNINFIGNDVEFIDIIQAFVWGLRFDVVVSSYILILPFVLLSINSIFEKKFKVLLYFSFL